MGMVCGRSRSHVKQPIAARLCNYQYPVDLEIQVYDSAYRTADAQQPYPARNVFIFFPPAGTATALPTNVSFITFSVFDSRMSRCARP
jgi:hypothetical protein